MPSLIDQLTADPDFLSLSESDQDKMFEELTAKQTPAKPNVRPNIASQALGINAASEDKPFNPKQAIIDSLLAVAPPNPATTALQGVRMVNRLPKQLVPPASMIAGGTAGQATGLPGSMSVGTGIGAGLGNAAVRFREMVQGQGQGSEQTPSQTLAESTVKGATTGIGTAALSGGLGLLGKGFQLAQASAPESVLKIAGRIRDSFGKVKAAAGDEFEAGLSDLAKQNPDKHISLRDTIDELRQTMQQNPKLASDINTASRRSGNTYLKDMLAKPELADDVTLEQAQAIKKTFDKVPSLAGKQGKFGAQYSDTDLDLLGYKNDIRAEMMKQFNELQDVYAKYAEKIQAFKQLKNKFKVGSLVDNVRQEFGDPETLAMVGRYLPPETVKEISLLSKALRAKDLAGKVGEGALKYGLAGLGGGTAAYTLLKLMGMAHSNE